MEHMFSSFVLLMMVLCVVGVVGVLSLCCGGLKGHFGPLRVVFVLVVSVLPEFFVPLMLSPSPFSERVKSSESSVTSPSGVVTLSGRISVSSICVPGGLGAQCRPSTG